MSPEAPRSMKTTSPLDEGDLEGFRVPVVFQPVTTTPEASGPLSFRLLPLR